ncbi:unnamed protein product [Mytilus coruscus]|uniref:Uncharacterized protein n=1 Tax=Mytilus coruscus TaxID=42192 RepID=A0A6J8EV18_MYTCO|nr:unnamed protein product [Mytilus coruscus]
MGKTALLVLVVSITLIKHINGIPNFACTGRGGYCSDSDTCSSLGGHVDKLSARCNCGNACCKCTGQPNFACTDRGGNCSDLDTCPSLGGQVEKLSTVCKCGKACCKCTAMFFYLIGKTWLSIVEDRPCTIFVMVQNMCFRKMVAVIKRIKTINEEKLVLEGIDGRFHATEIDTIYNKDTTFFLE